jgi:hypothetical protein
MRKSSLWMKLLLAALVVVAGAASATLHSSSKDSQELRNGRGADGGDEPVADYASYGAEAPEKRARRLRRNGRFSAEVFKESPDRGLIRIIRGDWLETLPAIPAALSDSVIVGEVVAASAYLSEDRTALFSEFTVRVAEVLKNSARWPLVPGESLSAEREGGKVRYPSGRVQRYKLAHQGMPRVGGRYLLFLRRPDRLDEEVPYILTGYELRSGRVRPIDGTDLSSDGRLLPQFAVLEGVSEEQFFGAVRAELVRAASSEGEV